MQDWIKDLGFVIVWKILRANKVANVILETLQNDSSLSYCIIIEK